MDEVVILCFFYADLFDRSSISVEEEKVCEDHESGTVQKGTYRD